VRWWRSERETPFIQFNKRNPNMKYTTCLLAFGVCILAGCHGPAQDEAQRTAAAIQDAMKSHGPPQVATSEGGYVMQAVVDGKPWKATGMMEINASNDNFIRGTGGGVELGFYVDTEHVNLGKESPLGEGHSADLTVGDGSWHAISGGYTIDKIDPTLIAGRFHFTARKFQSDQTLEVTDGAFRAVPKAAQ
jgi:hypothetical protein